MTAGYVAGLTTRGELLVVETRANGSAAALTIVDAAGGRTTRAVSLRERNVQIAAPAGNERWVVWIEHRGFGALEADWSLWAFDRESFGVRQIAERSAITEKIPPAMLDIVPSLAGNVVVWSARRYTAGRETATAYAADLVTGAVRRLAADAAWIRAIGPGAALAVTTDHFDAGGRAAAVVSRIDIETGAATPLSWIAPQRVAFFAASATSAIVVGAPPDAASGDAASGDAASGDAASGDAASDAGSATGLTLIDVATGTTRSVSMSGAAWPVAGQHFVAWSTDDRTLVMPDGAPVPLVVAMRHMASWVVAEGPWLAWWDGDGTTVASIARVSCRG